MRNFRNKKNQSGVCSSYNMGLPLRSWLRICSAIGMVSALMYIISGTSLITHIAQNEKATFSSMGVIYSQKTRHIYYKRNAEFFTGIAIVLVLINFVQLASDAMLFHSTLKMAKPRSLWIFFLLDVILWVLTLICFVTIFSGGGLFLLLVFLLGTAIRAYIVFILHEFMTEELKIHDMVPIQPSTQIETVESGVSRLSKREEEKRPNEPKNDPPSVILEVEETMEVAGGDQNNQTSKDELKQQSSDTP